MSVTPSQPLMPSSEPAPVVSDISAPPQPLPVVSPAPVNGTAPPSGTSGASVNAGSVPAATPGPAHSVPAPPSHGPSPASAPPPPQPQFNSLSHSLSVQQRQGGVPQQQQQQQYWGHQPAPSYTSQRPPQPVPSNHQPHHAQPVYPPPQPVQAHYHQSQPAQYVQEQQQNYQPQSSRPVIMEPPRKRASMGMAAPTPQTSSVTSGFPSPTKDYPSVFPKFKDDLSRNSLAIKQSVPEAVRQAVRDNWEKCLLGSEFHQAFVLNASMHHSTPSVQNRAVHDFGAKLVENCKADIIAHFSNRDLDEVADQILAKASNAFLDKALEMRLATIDAKPLLNALARAERLGYDSQDLVEVSQGEHVIPHTVNGQTPTGVSHTAGARAAHPSEPQCLKCFRTFAKKSYFDYHVSRSVCSKIPPTDDGFRYACSKCAQGFTQTSGLSYHLSKNVCEGGVDAASEPQHGGLPATPGSVRSTASPAHPAMTQTPSSQPARTNVAGVMPANRPSDLGAASKGSPIADPYGHLSKEEMDKLNAELLQAEELYAGRFQEAEAMPEGEAKRARIDSLKNTFGTKQSMIRKKYGVRLRERRTRAEILAEKERMGVRGKAARAGSGSPAPTQQQQHQTPTSSAWTPANRVVSVDLTADDPTPSLKRRRMDEGGGYVSPYPPQHLRTGPATRVSEMAGGLTASSATAAIHDPTLPPSSTPAHTFQQAGARVEIHLPSKPSPSKPSSAAASTSGAPNGSEPRDDSRTPDMMDVDTSAAQLQEENTKADGEQEQREESANESGDGNENGVIDLDDDSDDDDDEDIPSSLPPNVRQSLKPTPLGPMY